MNAGHLINYMSTDVYQIEYGILFLPYMITGFIQAIIVIIIFSLQNDFSYAAGFAFIIILAYILKAFLTKFYSRFKYLTFFTVKLLL